MDSLRSFIERQSSKQRKLDNLRYGCQSARSVPSDLCKRPSPTPAAKFFPSLP